MRVIFVVQITSSCIIMYTYNKYIIYVHSIHTYLIHTHTHRSRVPVQSCTYIIIILYMYILYIHI